MRTLSTGTHSTYDGVHLHEHHSILVALENWIKEQEPTWEYYRFGIGAVGIFIQVTFAGLMIATLGMAGASPWVYGIGIFFAFAANSAVFAQSPMRIVLGLVIASIILNLLLTLSYVIPMLLS
jgi:hypothetical protein